MVVIQEEKTGCGIASVANIIGKPYSVVKSKANSIGIFAVDEALYSETVYVRKLLNEYGISSSTEEVPFTSWESLPKIALLSVKYHLENGKPFWHWVVFKRESELSFVLDPAPHLKKMYVLTSNQLTLNGILKYQRHNKPLHRAYFEGKGIIT